MSRRLILLGLAQLALVAAGLTLWVVGTDRLYSGRVLPGVTVGGADAGGLSSEDLASLVERLAAPELNRLVTVRAGAFESTIPAGALGLTSSAHATATAALAVGRTGSLIARIRARLGLLREPVEVPITYHVDPAAVRQAVERLAAAVDVPPRDARVTVEAGRLVAVKPSQDGVGLDEAASFERLITALERCRSSADLVVVLRRPAFTTEMAAQMSEPVARFTTFFPYNPDRIHNIRLAAGALRGLLLPPDAVLSYNEAVGPRDPARGYRKAPVLINNELVPGDGGGVCQVSSTLFNAALLAEMEVEERTNHSRPVPYLAAGLDATVEYGSIDLRLRNTTGHHLYLWTDVGPRSLTVTFFGRRQPGREVIVAVTDRTVVPAPTHTVVRHDHEVPAGQTRIEPARAGLRVRTLRVIRQDGVVVRQDVVAHSYYQPTPRTVKIGSGPPPRRISRTTSAP